MHFSMLTIAFMASLTSAIALPRSANTTSLYDSCDSADYACRTAPDANESYCSSQTVTCCDDAYATTACEVVSPASDELCFAPYSACYTNVGLTAPTSTPNVTAYDVCAKQSDACRTAPDANFSYCGSQASTCCDKAYNGTKYEIATPAGEESHFQAYTSCYTEAYVYSTYYLDIR